MSSQPGGLMPPLDPHGQGDGNKRLLVTVALISVLWLGMTSWFGPKPGAALQKPATPIAVAPASPGAAAGAAANVARPEPPLTQHVVSADVAKQSASDTIAVKGGYEAEITSAGAQIERFTLTGYEDNSRRDKETKKAPPIDLANGELQGAHMLALRARGGDVDLAANAGYELLKKTNSGTTFERLTSSGVRVTRTLAFEAVRFAFTETVVLKNEASTPRTASLDLVLVGSERDGERDEGSMFSPAADQLAGACFAGEDREHFTSKDIENKPKSFPGAVKYAALDRHYFLAAVVPVGVDTTACHVKPWKLGERRGFELVVEQAALTLQPGETKSWTVEAYFGPKQVELLEGFGHGLEENIDFGFFGVLSRPMLWVIVELHARLGDFGLAIILLTLLVKALTFPLTQKAYVGMQQMKKLQPELKKLQDKHGADRTALAQKQMELYQKEGINPLAGCLPMLVQMPIWFALYRTLSQAVELYQQPFVPMAAMIPDLTQPDMILFGWPLLPLIVGALMMFQTWLQPPPDDQPQMKVMMWIMPIMFTFLMLQMAAGLSIYMITNSVLTMAQQLYIKKRYS